MQLKAEDLLRVEEGSLDPALYRLEERGWIESEWGTSENGRAALVNDSRGKKRIGSDSCWLSAK
jgi:PadR family transcriptional regulator